VSLADRFRARLQRRRPARELEARRPLFALPAPPHRRPVLVEEVPLCPRCRTRHESRPHPAGGGGMAAAYGRTILPDPTRPEPLNRQAEETPLVLRRHRPWHQP